MFDSNVTGLILFMSYFALYGLEYFFPLIRARRIHLLTNIGFAILLLALNLALAFLTLSTSDWIKANQIGLFNHVESPAWLIIVASILFLDFWAGYVFHFIFHKTSWLWHLHSIHHSDVHVDVTTTFRKHPIECLIGIAFNITGMLLLGIPSWILLAYLTLSTINAQFEHANIKLPAKLDRFLQWVIVTPNMHKIHHSIDEVESNSNYSNIFSFWDRLFSTYRTKQDYNSIAYGLDYVHENEHRSFWKLLKLPLKYYRNGKSSH